MPESAARRFHLGDLLSVTTGYLVSPRLVPALYDVLNHMTGDNLFTHQLPRAVGECAPEILRQHPDLAEVRFPEGLAGKAAVLAWLADQVALYGETRSITPLASEDHMHIDPLTEMEMLKPGRVIPIIVAARQHTGGTDRG